MSAINTGDPLYGIRRIARTRTTLLSMHPHHRLTGVLDADEHIAVKVAYVIYQKIIAAYADPNRRTGKQAMTRLIESIRRGVPAGLDEIAQLGRTLWRRDILAFFDHHASNGPTEAPPTAPPRRSTAAWKPCAATRLDSATLSTTDGANCSTAEHSTHSSMHSELRRARKALR
ncbi:transposase [Mycobacterium paraffinicum]|uniref:Transposase IS204/IS1001/IS1096/IS1165 DDE domain-containing protein n=1 Tax=Mycobacterium paraffinicum TaxID=53378 RepID=A0ABP8F3N3_9MYCO|nr:transposase [Mycobacterium paraffinicum]MCV7313560.1 transposase [Mycobacterium paraffinicum]